MEVAVRRYSSVVRHGRVVDSVGYDDCCTLTSSCMLLTMSPRYNVDVDDTRIVQIQAV
jgi:hypothetical protein